MAWATHEQDKSPCGLLVQSLLFILCNRRLSSLIREEFSQKSWQDLALLTIHCTVTRKIFTEKPCLFPRGLIWMPVSNEANFTLGLLFVFLSTLCLIAALTMLIFFCCQLSKVAFSMSLRPLGPWTCGRRAGCPATRKWDCFPGLHCSLCPPWLFPSSHRRE